MNKRRGLTVWGIFFGVLLTCYTAYVVLDAFVIQRVYSVVPTTTSTSSSTGTVSSGGSTGSSGSTGTVTTSNSAAVVSTDTTYSDGSISITLTQYREYDTDIYVADITLASADSLQTAFANSTYGRNITATTSTIASQANAILAINGDYYSARSGYVVRNGVLYRDTSSGSTQEDLVIGADGTFSIVQEGSVTAAELVAQGARQVLSFGPGLVSNGQVIVGVNDEVSQSMSSNPRTAIGQIGPLHYVMVVSDGRSAASTGLSLYQLAEFMKSLGATTAYNLDGGGSSTMVFNGTVVNNPTTSGKTIKERSVSDIVYIG